MPIHTRRSTQGYLSSNDDLAASTFAAQIVDNLSSGKFSSKNEDREKFRKLLQEILHTDDDGDEITEAVEKNVDVNHRLIYVVVRAGLESLLNEDPFIDRDELKKQAVESLSVVELTIRRSPEVLFSVLQRRETDLQITGPLYLWLIPKLFIVLVRIEEDDVRQKILQVIQTAIVSESKAWLHQYKFSLTLAYIQGCIKDLLIYSEGLKSSCDETHNLQQFLVPTLATISEVCPASSQDVDLQRSIQVGVASSSEPAIIISSLLSAIVSLGSKDSEQNPSQIIVSPDYDWILSCFTRLLHSIRAVKNSVLDFPHATCLVMSSKTLCNVLSQVNFAPYEILNVSRTSVLLSQVIVVLFNLGSKHVPAVEKSLCFFLLDLVKLCRNSHIILNAIDENLIPFLFEVTKYYNRICDFGADLKQSIQLVIQLCNKDNSTQSFGKLQDEATKFQDLDLQLAYDHKQHNDDQAASEGKSRARKRVRLSMPQENLNDVDIRLEIISTVCHVLSLQDGTILPSLNDIGSILVDRFSTLSEEYQTLAISAFGQMACIGAQTLSRTSPPADGKPRGNTCSVCDAVLGRTRGALCEDLDIDPIYATIVNLLGLIQKQKLRRPRVAAMVATRRLLSHTKSHVHLDMSNSPLGPWCLQALNSSVRDLRIAAGRTLPLFLRDSIDDEMLQNNRIRVFEFLRNLAENGELRIQETCILSWGQIALVSSNDEVNIVLLRLVEYLGHTNPLVCGVAYDELQQLSNHSSFSLMRLFMPYWRTIAPTVARDLQSRPQTAQYLSDLLAMSVSEFLCLTQVYTVPYLVLTKRRDILQRIADASGRTVMSLCMDHSNMAAILACILMHSSVDVENLIMALFNAISDEFRNLDSVELLRTEPILIVSELLKMAGENNEAQKLKAHQAISSLATLTHGRVESSRGTARKINSIGDFFETYVLAIMTHLAETINDGRTPQLISEKIRCIGAIREMITLASSYISNGLPQICACLRSAIEDEDLCNHAFSAWIVMISCLGEDEIGPMVDPTFAFIAQHWESFQHKLQLQTHESLSQLMRSHSDLVRDAVKTIPSLASIPVMSKFEEEIRRLKNQMDIKHQFQAFSQRCQSENATVVIRALTELESYLVEHQQFLHEVAMHEQPDPFISQLIRSVLDACVLFHGSNNDVPILCARCMGLIGCLDPTRIEAVRDKKEILLLSNLGEAEESKDFVIFFLREVLVKAFLSATNPRSQGFLAWAMQEMLKYIEFNTKVMIRPREIPFDADHYRWTVLPENVKNTLIPFLTSKYKITARNAASCPYPIYRPGMLHRHWLRTLTFDLLNKGEGGNVGGIFEILTRIIRTQDVSISNFLLPFAALNIVVNGTESQQTETASEMLAILNQQLLETEISTRESLILCSHNVFQIFDYLSRWMHEKKKEIADSRNAAARTGRTASQGDHEMGLVQIQKIGRILSMIPAEVISRRAIECKSFARALFHWEQYIRQQKHKNPNSEQEQDLEPLYEKLQDIYTQIDEPDGIEGISAHLQVLNIDQQILEHRKAGRWTAAQSWYELLLTEEPNNLDVQSNLLTSLKESGQHDVLLNQIDGFHKLPASTMLSLPFAVEASWVTGKWTKLEQYLISSNEALQGDFNVGIGRALLALFHKEFDKFSGILNNLRLLTAKSLSITNTTSLQVCHEALLKFHVIMEIEAISGVLGADERGKQSLLLTMNQRLDLLGASGTDKQYLLGLRRASMQLSNFSNIDLASAWLTTAKLARKDGFTHSAFNAVLHASQLGDVSATIEHSRLIWGEGHHRKAIQSLEGAIAANAFRSHDYTQTDESTKTAVQGGPNNKHQQQNLVKAKAYLLLAKWIDRAGQTQSDIIISRYKNAIDSCNRWEKGHYYLGKHYNKLLESEKAKPPGKQAQTFITGETGKLVIENYLRSVCFGAKYIYQTLPRILTLWLELGSNAEQPLDPKYGNDENFRNHTTTQRQKLLTSVNAQIKKYVDRLPPFVWYTAFSQLVARICQTNETISGLLIEIITKVVISHTAQAAWTLLALLKSSSKDRAGRGRACQTNILNSLKKNKSGYAEISNLLVQAQKLSTELLGVCEGEVPPKASVVKITEHLKFNHKVAPCKIAVPIESMLTASLPTVTENVNMKSHKAFSKDTITISAFLDEVQVLNSLQRPRKISVRGSDGRVYALLCKPKDDLRKDQRLMEFNAMINRALKKDAKSSKRQLYIKTYAVTPLNEECGLIEWVDKLKTLRDILLHSYKQKHVPINYSELRTLLAEASSSHSQLHIFHDQVIAHFPPVFHEWFVEMFPEPEAWFAARLRYTRSCAVMSIVGHVLGLGDRHGENILFEEGNGGTFHVDFNCLFDKGLTFEKPELVPFRLTHNMVDAFGAYGYEGPFRKSCELTLNILRQHEDTLMTILETFLYDPTTDFIGPKKKKKTNIVPDTPEGVLESVRNKVRGLPPTESVPLSVEGYVQELIQQAVDPFRLASMYIGWCAFF